MSFFPHLGSIMFYPLSGGGDATNPDEATQSGTEEEVSGGGSEDSGDVKDFYVESPHRYLYAYPRYHHRRWLAMRHLRRLLGYPRSWFGHRGSRRRIVIDM